MFSERVEGLRTASYSRFWHRSYQLVDLEYNHSKLFIPQATYYEISLAQDQGNLVKIESTISPSRWSPHVISCVARLYLVPAGGNTPWFVFLERLTSVYFSNLTSCCCLGTMNLVMIFICVSSSTRAFIQGVTVDLPHSLHV